MTKEQMKKEIDRMNHKIAIELEEVKSLAQRILNGADNRIQKTKIMASGPITPWEIDGETVETVSDFIFGGLQNHCRW